MMMMIMMMMMMMMMMIGPRPLCTESISCFKIVCILCIFKGHLDVFWS
jgi:hypothetical protein